MTIIRSAVVTHPLRRFTGTNAPERISFRISGTRASDKLISKTDARNFIGEHVSRLRRVQGRLASARCGNFRARRSSQNETDHSRANAEV
jgi:hypothetical protein